MLSATLTQKFEKVFAPVQDLVKDKKETESLIKLVKTEQKNAAKFVEELEQIIQDKFQCYQLIMDYDQDKQKFVLK